MPQPMSGPGVGLPLPQNLYPTELNNAPYDFNSNLQTLAAGENIVVPAGDWYIDIGNVSLLQFLDPITGTWRDYDANRGGLTFIKSDGFTCRIANLTGCPVAAIVVAGGSGYVQSSTTITPSTGNSTWQPIVGGQVTITSMAANGGNYGITPLVLIQSPPPGGVPATGYAVMSGGTVSTVSFVNVGAGYLTAPTAVILPVQTDPNLSSGITQASVVLGLAGGTVTSALTAVLCTNPGVPTASLPTLTVTGSGLSASVNAVTLSGLTGLTIGGNGAGYTNGTTQLQTLGGQPTGVAAYANPAIQLTGYRPRPASANVVSGSASLSLTSLGTIYDTGLFAGTATGILTTNGIVTTVATITVAQGTVTDTIRLQPAP